MHQSDEIFLCSRHSYLRFMCIDSRSAEKYIHDQCSVKSRVGVVLGLSESSATWDSDLTDRAIH